MGDYMPGVVLDLEKCPRRALLVSPSPVHAPTAQLT